MGTEHDVSTSTNLYVTVCHSEKTLQAIPCTANFSFLTKLLLNLRDLGIRRYGVYQSFYLQNNYFTGGSPLRYAFVGGLSVGTAFILAPIANYLSKRFTFRVPMLMGTCQLALLNTDLSDYGSLQASYVQPSVKP